MMNWKACPRFSFIIHRSAFILAFRRVMNYLRLNKSARHFSILIATLFLFISGTKAEALARNNQARTPTETVREFYRMMRERHFKEAFALSIYKPAIDGLSAEEFAELQPDFERMGAAIPEKIDIGGEQVSGDVATVFVKIADADKAAEAEPVTLIREGGVWIVGDRENQAVVKKAGKQFFFEARIETHHNEAQAMLQRISLAELAYASQHNNLFADLPTLIAAGLVPKDIETPDTTGYRFHLTLAKDAKSWSVGAEPVLYGRTGRLSFLLDQSGIRSADRGGKPLVVAEGEP
jgi:hypothetical protein